MTQQEVVAQLKMTYENLVLYLKNKYGEVQYNYFRTSECKSKNPKVFRTKEGLFCHHIDENKHPNISKPQIARESPFESQLAKNLVYCNYLEHIILHIKIFENYLIDEQASCGLGLSVYMLPEVNSFYEDGYFSRNWSDAIAESLRNSFDNYILILRYLWSVADLQANDAPRVKHKKISIIPSLSVLWTTQNDSVCQKIYEQLKDYEPSTCLFVTRKDFIKIKFLKFFVAKSPIENQNIFLITYTNPQTFSIIHPPIIANEISFNTYKWFAVNETKQSLNFLKEQVARGRIRFKFYKYNFSKITKENKSLDYTKLRIANFKFLRLGVHEYYPKKAPLIETFFETL